MGVIVSPASVAGAGGWMAVLDRAAVGTIVAVVLVKAHSFVRRLPQGQRAELSGRRGNVSPGWRRLPVIEDGRPVLWLERFA